MQPIIKWPGGKSAELGVIERYLPENYARYVEPFFGGGALFFKKCPESAVINDISQNLMGFYRYVAGRNGRFFACLKAIDGDWCKLKRAAAEAVPKLRAAFDGYMADNDAAALAAAVRPVAQEVADSVSRESHVLPGGGEFESEVEKSVLAKLIHTADNARKRGFISEEDIFSNTVTGFTAGFYNYLRGLLNADATGAGLFLSREYITAVYFFVREFCYGSLFRYNRKGEFNVPYGGISYNGKNFAAKIHAAESAASVLSRAEIMCGDFGAVFDGLNDDDFVFLDPPYDSDFSDYEEYAFGEKEHRRLAERLASTKARFLLVIKNTPLIDELYSCGGYEVEAFDNRYTCCVRGRNDRAAVHLIIRNYK